MGEVPGPVRPNPPMTKFSTDRFLADCGATGPIRLTVHRDGDAAETAYIFQQPSVLIGSHERANLRLAHPQVGARQLYLQVLSGRLFAVQVSTRTETRWGGAARLSGWVDPDEPITFGPYTVRLAAPVGAAAGLPTHDPQQPMPGTGPVVTLELLRVGAASVYGVLDRDLSLVGTAGICRVRLRDPRVSTVHCALVRTPGGYWAVDLCGRGGVRVNGVVAHVARLEHGDVLGLDGQDIRILYDRSAADPPEADRRRGALAGAGQPAAPMVAGYPAPSEEALAPLLDRFAEFQDQTFEQFRGLLQSMAQTFAAMLNEQRAFVRDELERLERLAEKSGGGPERERIAPAQPDTKPLAEAEGAPAGATTPFPSPSPPTANHTADSQVHLWFEAQLNALRGERASMWQRLFGPDRDKSSGESQSGGR